MIVRYLSVFIGLIVFCNHYALAVTNGVVTAEDKYAAVVRIHNCTAVFVHPRVLLTAAHCIPANDGPKIEMQQNRRTTEAVILEVEKIMGNPEYADNIYNYDIGFILLREPITDLTILNNLPKIAV